MMNAECGVMNAAEAAVLIHHSSFRIHHFLFIARWASERHVADDLQLEAFERRHTRGVVREQQYAAQAQLVQYLRADAVVSVFAVAGLDARLLLRQAPLPHELVGA